jgi:hypothetical protein
LKLAKTVINSLRKIVDDLLLSDSPEEQALMDMLLLTLPLFADLAFCFEGELVELVCMTLQGWFY